LNKNIFTQKKLLTLICSLLPAILCLFTACDDPKITVGGDDNNSSGGKLRAPNVSKNSGLYPQPFSVELTASAGTLIYYSIDGSVPDPKKADNKIVFKYSSPIAVADRNNPMQKNLLATASNSKNFYGDPSDPRGSMPEIYYPSDNQVPKATVIRAIAADSSGTRKSDVVTRTYFIGNNLANYANHPVISLVTDPYNLVDVNYGIMVRGALNNRWDPPNQYNFMGRGVEWERVASMEYFAGNTGSRSVPVSTNVGIRIRGGWSRAAGQKSFNVYFRGEYGGLNNLTGYQLIPGAVRADGTPVGTYKSFMLRNGANDSEYTKFYDVFLQDLLKNRSFTAQAGVPCIVYINGEYWGLYNLQERYSDNATEYKYGVNRNNVISYDNGALDDGNPGEESHYWNMAEYRKKDLSIAQNYNDFCKLADIQNLIDYFAAQIYIHNEDWPHNNFRLWRTRAVESGNPYGDTKWRWQMFDVEFALGIYSSGGLEGQSGKDPFYRILYGDHSYHSNSELFKALTANPDFCRDFINTMMDLYNVNFHPDVYEPKLNEYAASYGPLMGDSSKGYFARWGGWPDQFNNKVNDARKYLRDIRSAMTGVYLPQYFNASGLTNVTFAAKHDNNIMNSIPMKINTVTPPASGGTWTGQYFQSSPITVTANDINGYNFVDWTVTGGDITSGNGGRIITVTLNNSNVQITANYSANIIVVPVTSVSINKYSLLLSAGRSEKLTASVLPLDATYKTVMWSSNNNSVAIVDQNGNVKAVAAGTAAITAAAGSVSKTCDVTVTAPQPLNWSWYCYGNNGAVVSSQNMGEGEYSADVTKLGYNNWDAIMCFNYQGEAEANIRYKYSFWARTESGTRNNMYIQYYWTQAHGSKGNGYDLTNTYQYFEFIGDALPTSEGSEFQFQAGGQLGKFYVKDVVIMPFD